MHLIIVSGLHIFYQRSYLYSYKCLVCRGILIYHCTASISNLILSTISTEGFHAKTMPFNYYIPLGDYFPSKPFIYNDSQSMRCYIEDTTSLSMVELVRHALLNSSITLQIYRHFKTLIFIVGLINIFAFSYQFNGHSETSVP